MAISNNTTGYRPGVCTSTTRPTAPYEGQMIFETDTNRVLVWDNAAWVMIADTDTPPGMQLLSSNTLSGSSFSMSNIFTSEFRNYRVVVSIESCSSAADIKFRLRDSGGDHQTSYTYGFFLTDSTGTANLGSSSDTGGKINLYYTSGGTAVADFILSNPQTSGVTTSWSGTSGHYYTAGGRANFFGGSHYISQSFTGLTIFTTAGTFTGTVRVYGMRD